MGILPREKMNRRRLDLSNLRMFCSFLLHLLDLLIELFLLDVVPLDLGVKFTHFASELNEILELRALF